MIDTVVRHALLALLAALMVAVPILACYFVVMR